MRVDAGLCRASGLGALRVPKVFDQDEETGTVVLLVDRPPAALAESVVATADTCPARAIEVDEEARQAVAGADCVNGRTRAPVGLGVGGVLGGVECSSATVRPSRVMAKLVGLTTTSPNLRR